MKKLVLAPLPYDYNALEPVISAKIMQLHHDKHHLAYVNGANAALDKLDAYQKGGPEINVRETMRDLSFNYNGHKMHELFWNNMRSVVEGNKPSEKVLTMLTADFGSWEAFMKEFSSAAVGVEGSGWAVLVSTEEGLAIHQFEKHNLAGLVASKPVLAIDVWEHAYYLDYLNDRKSYVEKWWNVVNWDDVEKRLSA